MQSFLGCDTAPDGCQSSLESPEQHRDKQCKPMRVATFEFDYKKQRTSQTSHEAASLVTTPKSRWFDATFTSPTTQTQNPTDLVNGNDEPLSLSHDCLQDIRALTSSLHNLMDNINEPERSNKSSPNVSISIQSPKNNNDQDSLHSANRRNGNSLSDIHSSISTTPIRRNHESPKSIMCNINKPRAQRKNLYNTNGASVKTSSIDRLSQSTDCLSGSSDNNIETSDSFVNIQFANAGREERLSSKESLDSSESFENVQFKVPVSRIPRNLNRTRLTAPGGNQNDRTDQSDRSNVKLRVSQIPVHINGQTSRSDKPGNDTVKLRERKSLGCDKNRKRFSYVPNARRQDVDNVNRSVGNGRKCSSTDELRETDDKPVKTNRHSLYYTPQLPRKTYETDNSKSPKPTRPTSWKSWGSRDEGDTSLSNLNKSRQRKSDGSTVASRSKANRQSIHGRSSIGGNLPTGRTK